MAMKGVGKKRKGSEWVREQEASEAREAGIRTAVEGEKGIRDEEWWRMGV